MFIKKLTYYLKTCQTLDRKTAMYPTNNQLLEAVNRKMTTYSENLFQNYSANESK